MRHLFAYGTLMCSDIMAEISGLNLSRVSAVLRGYRRICVKGEHYPALVPYPAGYVEGVLYLNVPDPVWPRLDRFEGKMYLRGIVQVESANGGTLSAETYVARTEFMDCLLDTEWDFEEFLRNHKENFRSSYKGYQALK